MRKSSKRVAAEPQWQWSPEDQNYYYRYIDDYGQEQFQWAPIANTSQEDPRDASDDVAAAGQSLAQLNVDDDYTESSLYTHQRQPEGSGSYAQQDAEYAQPDTGYAEPGVDYTEPGARDYAAVDPVTDTDHEDGHHPVAGSPPPPAKTKKVKSQDKKLPTQDRRPPPKKKDPKEKSRKGKEKDARRQDPNEPPDPFFDPSQHQQRGQHQRVPRQNRATGQPGVPQPPSTGTSGSGTSHPIDPGYGAETMDPEEGDYHQPAGEEQYQGEQYEEELQNDVGVPEDIPESELDIGHAGGFAPQQEESFDEEDDEALQAAINASRNSYRGEGVYDPYANPGFGQPESSHAPNAYEILNEEDDGSVTPTRANPLPEVDQVIRGTHGTHEQIDRRYRVESSQKFQPGEVFKILWSEPLGHNSSRGDNKVDIAATYTEKIKLENAYGEKFYVGFRRFIIIANDEGHCACVPILTYIRQGCKKKGAKPAKHGIVHEYGHKVKPLPDEPKLGFKPIRMHITASGEKLARESRVNYSKLVTVEHNVKVFFIGQILPDDFDKIVRNAVDQCWQEKIHKRVQRQLGDIRE